MGHQDSYQYKATARGIRDIQDVVRSARQAAYIYDRLVLPWLPTEKNSRIAELACGHGSFLCWLKERQFSNIEGVDSSAEQILFAKLVSAKVFRQDVNEWLKEQPLGSLAAIVGFDLMENLSQDEF